MEIDLNKAHCREVALSSPVKLEGDGDDVKTFSIIAYTGAVVDRWWGKLALALDGMSSKQRMPIFRDHDPAQIVGYSTEAEATDVAFVVRGKFSKTSRAAREVQGLATEGFPWQASVRAVPLQVVSVSDGENYVVNGKEIAGPAEVWTKTRIEEVSFVPLGADDATSVAVFSKVMEAKGPNVTEKEDVMEITLEMLTKDAPALLEAIRSEAKLQGEREGAERERARIAGVFAQRLPGHDELIERLAFDGKTTPEQAAVQVLAAERALQERKREDLRADGIAPVSTPAAPNKPAQKQAPQTREEFSQCKELVEEFGDWETYSAFERAQKANLFRIIGGKR